MGGRGSWSSSGGTFTPTVGGMSNGGAVDENVLGPRIPITLQEALGQKGRPMSIAAASAGTNPHYNRDYAAYSSNCQRCVLTYEARRRGYDVTALSNPKTVDVGKSKIKLESQMRGYGNGARAIVHVSARGKGHEFIAENVRGRINYVDPQTNKRYSNINLSNVSGSRLTRIDNQDFTEYARNAFTRKRV